MNYEDRDTYGIYKGSTGTGLPTHTLIGNLT